MSLRNRGRVNFAMLLGILLIGRALCSSLQNDSEARTASLQGLGASDEEMQDLLNWAIKHSDPSKLAELAAEASSGDSKPSPGSPPLEDIDAILKKRKELKETMEYLSKANPSEAVLMKEAIAVANRTSGLPLTDPSLESDIASIDPLDSGMLLKALEQLASLVEPIDNANDFPKLGGLTPVFLAIAKGPTRRIQCAALEVLRVASSNNPTFVDALLLAQPSSLKALSALALGKAIVANNPPSEAGAGEGDPSCDVSVKALAALSNVLRAHPSVRDAFLNARGDLEGVSFLVGMFERTTAAAQTQTEKLELRLLSLAEDVFESGSMGNVGHASTRSLATVLVKRLMEKGGHMKAREVAKGEWEVEGSEGLEKALRATRSLLRESSGVSKHGRPERDLLGAAGRALKAPLKELERAAKEDDMWAELRDLAKEVQRQLMEKAEGPDEDIKGIL